MATQDDFAAANYHASVAVYCGSIPKFKPRYTALRGGSIDSNLQFCGSSWTTEEEASFQSILTMHLKKQPSLWDGDGDGKSPSPRDTSPLDDWTSKASVHDLSSRDGGDLSHLSRRALTRDPRESEVRFAAPEIILIKDELKTRRMSEGLLTSHRGLTECSGRRGVTLRPALSSSASQGLLVTFRPAPPIQKSPPSSEPRRMSNGGQKHGENSTGCVDSDGNNKELMSEASQLPSYCSGGDRKKSLGVALPPPIPKSARPSGQDPGSAAVPLISAEHLVFHETLEMRPRRPSSRSEGKTLKNLELQTLEPVLPALQHHVVGGTKSAEHLREPMPRLNGLPLSQAKEMDHLVDPCFLSDDDLKDSNGRIHVILSKSAQKKIEQERMRQMELLRRVKEKQKEKSLQLLEQSGDLGDAAKETFGPPPVNGEASISASVSNACKDTKALRKRVNRPSLPSIPVVRKGGNFPRKSSVNSLPAIALDSTGRREKPECGDAREVIPFIHPQQELLNVLTWLSNDDWEQKAKALSSVRRLAICHSEVLLDRLHDVSLAVTREVNNLRSKVSRFAISTLGELFRTLKKHMDHEVDEVARVLLQRMGDTSEFIQKAASQSLGIMVVNVTPARAMTALMASGIQHRNVLVRRCAAEHLLTVMEQIGAEKLLSGTRDSTNLLVHTVVKLAQDAHQDTRCYGRKMLSILMGDQKFDKYLKKSVPSRDLEDVMAIIKQKGIGDRKCEHPSAKHPKKSKNRSLMMARDNLPSDGGSKSCADLVVLPRQPVHRPIFRTAEETEQLGELCRLLTSKEFRTRIEGVEFLLGLCKSNPQLISTGIVQIFDLFTLRLQDCNKKVNQQALEALALMIDMLRDDLHPVLVLMLEAVTDNLNSKHLGIYAAAVKALEAAVAHLDNTLLLQALAPRVPFLSGQALLDITERLSELQTLEPVLPALQHHVVGGTKSAEHLREPMPRLNGLPLSQAKEMDHLVDPCFLSDDDLKDSNGRIHVILSKSAQKKIEQERMRQMELLRRVKEKQKEKSLQLLEQSGDLGDAAKETFGPPPVNGEASISASVSNACKDTKALRKRVNRPSLPSIPVVRKGGNFPRKSSVNSLPAIALDSTGRREKPECGDAREVIHFIHPQQELLNVLTWLSNDDWEQKAKALSSVRRLAICHSEVLLGRLHGVSLAVTREVNNLRSKVSRFAISTLGELFRTLKKHMDHEVDEVARVLLQRMGDTSEFIQKAASQSLGIMVVNVTPARAMTALMASGIQHRNILVRRCAAEHLLTVMEQIGAEKLLSGTRDSTNLLVHTVVKLAQDAHQDTRCYVRKMLSILMGDQKFDKYLKKSVPSRDLEDVMAIIKGKGIGDRKCEHPSAKHPKKSKNRSLMTAQDNLPSDGGSKSCADLVVLPRQPVHRPIFRTAEETEQLRELCRLLTSKEFRTRIEGVEFLLGLCKSNPQLISTDIVQIFDLFTLRLQDCNKKVNQQALEALALMIDMLRDDLHPVLVLMLEAVTDNLNSKHLGIYAAAVKALEAAVAHLDNTLLLQALAPRVPFLSGQALLDITEHLSVLVESVYPQKPQTVERCALPVLWFLLGTRALPVRSGNVRGVVTKLAKSLYKVMGSKLKKYAASQPQHVMKNLCKILGLNVG